MKLSEKLPPFRLPGTDQLLHSSGDFDQSKPLVVVFTCNHCPYARAYIRRIAGFVRKYRPLGVSFVAINPNDAVKYPDDSFENMIPMSKELGLDGLYLRDESQETARAFDAKRTPEVFVFDRDRSLAYHGAIDDNYENENEVDQHYLRDALDSLLNGTPIAVTQSNAVGCSIKWK